jgi:hypothetical protein
MRKCTKNLTKRFIYRHFHFDFVHIMSYVKTEIVI